MNQLSLDLDELAYPSFDKLLGHANAELIYMLQQKHDPFLYIWGESGAGKSHILQAWVGQALAKGMRAIYIDPKVHTLTDLALAFDYIAIDHIEVLSAHEQAELFYIFNTLRNRQQGHLLLSADVPPHQLVMREDLRTRMSFCLSYQVKALSREEKIEALSNMAKVRQLDIDSRIFRYLVDNWRSDLQSLLTMFDDLANYSIAKHKRITLSLLKTLLIQQE